MTTYVVFGQNTGYFWSRSISSCSHAGVRQAMPAVCYITLHSSLRTLSKVFTSYTFSTVLCLTTGLFLRGSHTTRTLTLVPCLRGLFFYYTSVTSLFTCLPAVCSSYGHISGRVAHTKARCLTHCVNLKCTSYSGLLCSYLRRSGVSS